MEDRKRLIEEVKKVIKEYYNDADLGIFFSRNIVGDFMCTIWTEGDITIDICYYYSYFEIFGLTLEEQKEVETFYNTLEYCESLDKS